MDNDQSYSEAMNEWARKNSFFGNQGNRLIHPDPNHPLIARILGYLFRIVVAVFLIGMVVFYGLRKWVGSAGYGEKVGSEIAALLDAEEFESTPLQWKGTRMSVNLFKAKGREDAFYHTLEARYFRFDSSPMRFLGSSWNLKEVTLNTLAVHLKSGGKTSDVQSTASTAWGEIPRVLTAGIGGEGRGKLSVESLKVAEAGLDWGLSNATRGSLSGAGLVFVPGDGGWRLDIAGGKWSQNWLKSVNVDKLSVLPEGESLVFRDGEITFASGGKGAVTGSIAMGPVPQVDLLIAVEGAHLSDFVPERFANFVDAKIAGELRLTGSINTKSGVEIAADLRLGEGILRNIPLLDSTSILTETTRIRHLSIDSGTLKFRTVEGVLNVSEFEVTANDTARVSVSLAFTPQVREMVSDDPLDALSTEETDATSAVYLCEGKLRFGVPADSLERAKEVGDSYFSAESDGYRWLEADLRGVPEELTRELHDRMIDDIRKLRGAR